MRRPAKWLVAAVLVLVLGALAVWGAYEESGSGGVRRADGVGGQSGADGRAGAGGVYGPGITPDDTYF
jgi:hypothetical protein